MAERQGRQGIAGLLGEGGRDVFVGLEKHMASGEHCRSSWDRSGIKELLVGSLEG